MSDIKIIALGGVRENAKNLYVVEVNDSIFVLDAGLRYPENEQLGVDEVIPNLDYLIENKKRVQGIFLTHGHADAIGALPYILSEFKAPVFGSPLTIELAKLFVKKNTNVKKFNNFHVIDAETEIEFADATISFFKTTHSVPESLGIVVGTDEGNIVRTAIRMKRLRLVDEKLIIKPKDMHKYEDHELIILEAGRMGEPINGLHKMALGRHRYVQIKDGDLVYIVTTPSLSKEAAVARVENLIYKAGGIVHLISQSLNVSGHANARDLQLMLNLLQPKYLFPVQGEYRNLAAHAELAEEVGMYPENIYIVKRGDVMVLGKNGFNHEGSVPAGDVMIDGNAIGDVGNIVLRDRKVLSEDGIFIVALTVNKREKKIVSKAKIHTRGFVYVKKSRDILRESAELVNQTVENYLEQENFDWGELKGAVRDEVAKFLFDQTKRRPAILPVVMEVR